MRPSADFPRSPENAPVNPESSGLSCSEKFIRWGFGEFRETSPLDARSSDFFFHFLPSAERREHKFRKEILNACEQMEKNRNGREIALCLSGGIFSEAIAHALNLLDIPFQMFFVDNWGLNSGIHDSFIRPLEKRIGRNVNVVNLDRLEFAKTFKSAFLESGVEYPNCLILRNFFLKYANDYFFVMGDGHLDRTGPLYAQIERNLKPYTEKVKNKILFSTSSIFFHLLSKKHGVKGEFYFYRSNPGLLASVILDQRFDYANASAVMRELIYENFPMIERRPKNTNWETAPSRKENLEIRKSIYRLMEKSNNLQFWKPSIGTYIEPERIFYP